MRRVGWRRAALLAFCSVALNAGAAASGPRLEIRPPKSNGWVQLNTVTLTNALITLEASSNLLAWETMATLHDGAFDFPDAAARNFRQRFYRVSSRARVATNDWKNQILFPAEPFRSDPTAPVRWVKFAILLSDPTRVFYQHSTNYPFHYDFARQRLPPFLGMDHTAFDAIALRRTNQQVVLGAVLYPRIATFIEYGIQFVGMDAYPPEDICGWFELVRATVHPATRATALYMPTFEQRATAEANRTFFEAKGIPVTSIERWVNVNHCYASGWAFGRLKFFPAAEIDEAYADGRLRTEDILLTDGVPAETPLVSGIISLTPSTPNSHVAILAESFGIPFVYFPDPAERERVQGLAGREVIIGSYVQFDRCNVDVIDVEGTLTPAKKEELLAMKQAPPIRFTPKTAFGAISASTDTLTPADIRFFGGKAANYGLLRQWVPGNAPSAIAFSFDLWDAFLNQTLPGGNILRAEINTRLAPFTNFPPDIASLKTNLAIIRDLFTRTARFNLAQQQAITNALRVFNPGRKIRFRSSTNVEDSEHFTGAGLYDSFSGCLLDDHDSDTTGPSHCDATENNERGVFRAIQRVYASFYNDNAFLERLRHGVDESKVAMGVLVHHSFPDEEELANGVATLRFNFTTFSTNVSGDLVTQYGATPVTNPDGSAAPEVVDTLRFGSHTSVELEQYSSLVPLGASVMNWPAEYVQFMDLFTRVGYGFQRLYPARNNYYLDFEYKKDLNLGLVVKQVREVPSPSTTNQVTTFMVDDAVTWCVAQEEFGDVFANHRLKSLWLLHVEPMRLSPSNLTQTVFREGSLEYLTGTNRQTLTGLVASWPNASNSMTSGVANDYWTTGSGAEQRAWHLETDLIETVTGGRPPIVTPQDFRTTLTVSYANPVPAMDYMGKIFTRTNESVRLVPCLQLHPGVILVNHTFRGTNAANGHPVTVETSYYWPKPPGAAAGYTAPLIHFVETRITGLTTNAIVLHDYFSQTYRPGHHNFSEEYIFEPRLEPSVAPDTLAELAGANIQFLHIHRRIDDRHEFTVLGLNGVLRKW